MYDNKKIFILGMARSGYEVAKLLASHNCDILITDAKEQDSDHIKELLGLNINCVITENQVALLDDSFDYVIKNPGIKLDAPVIVKANKLNIPVINELEVAYHYLPKNVQIVGVTGSNGKTTTTTLVYQILKEGNVPVHLGGNIGYPFSSLVSRVKENDVIVLELSAQQLHDFQDFQVSVGILTNLTEVHIDHFKTYENYKRCKKRIFDNCQLAIINAGDEDSMNLTNDLSCNKAYFSSKIKKDIYIENNYIYAYGEDIIALNDIRLKGNHNYENIMCAIAVAKYFNVSNEAIKRVLGSFAGVEHRLEFVRKLNNREFYNDSKATNVKSTQIALSSFRNPVILLLGGLDRNHSFEELYPFMEQVRYVICYGETKNRIKEFCDKHNIECYIKDNLKEATKVAYDLSNEGDTILLSPACASWDQYDCFESRGNDFKQTVEELN